MRVSSVIRPFSRGTLKSTRTNTRAPLRSGRSLTVRFATSKVVLAAVARGHVADQVLHAVREPPLVVVPREHLGQVSVDDLGQGGVDDRRGGVAGGIDRAQLH